MDTPTAEARGHEDWWVISMTLISQVERPSDMASLFLPLFHSCFSLLSSGCKIVRQSEGCLFDPPPGVCPSIQNTRITMMINVSINYSQNSGCVGIHHPFNLNFKCPREVQTKHKSSYASLTSLRWS